MKPLCVVSCPIDTFSGYGARSRDFVKALIQVKGKKWDIKIMPQKWGDTPWNFIEEDNIIRSHIMGGPLNTKPNIWIMITIPNEFQPVGDYNIGITAGIESTLYSSEFIEGFNRMDLNLVSSHHSKNIALSTAYDKFDKKTNQKIGLTKIEKPIEILFEGLDLNNFFKNPNLKSNILEGVDEEFCFLYTGGWLPGDLGEDRKNTGLMVKTFLEAFNTPSNKKPALILKTQEVNHSIIDREKMLEKINNIKKQVKGNLPNIYLIHGQMTDGELNELNNNPKIKAFISFTKGEGFGRPLLEQAITGKPVITTNWSGHLDFLKPEYNILLGGELKPIHESAANKWLIKESKWFNINADIASRAMKDIFKHYKKYWENSRKQTQYLKDNFSLDKMAEKIANLMPKGEMVPQTPSLNLPKLKKINKPEEKKIELPKLKLPKLKKIEV